MPIGDQVMERKTTECDHLIL